MSIDGIHSMIPDIFWYVVMSVIVVCAVLSLWLQVASFRREHPKLSDDIFKFSKRARQNEL